LTSAKKSLDGAPAQNAEVATDPHAFKRRREINDIREPWS